jgi:hypothetical protein
MAVGFPTKVSYANGDVFSASDINDTNGTLNLLGSSVAYTAGKNVLINGGFQFWQRGTSSAGTAYLADRWYSALISGTGTFAQESTVVPTGSIYSQKFTAGALAQPAIYQAVETLNAIRYAGQTMTVSAKVAASTSVGFTADVQYSTSTDNGVTGTWTSITATSGGTATATSTTFVSISGVYAIPSTAKSLRVRLFTTSTIAIGVVVYFGQIQLEQGSTATAFQTATGTIQGELAACQRYYQKSFPQGTAPAQNAGKTGVPYFCLVLTGALNQTIGGIRFPVNMRITPTVTIYNPDAANAQVRIVDAAANCTATAVEQTGETGFGVTATGPAAAGAGSRAVFHYSADAEL